ncbi:MAG: hypothetical protein JNM89_09145 [Hyphomicrobiaceae bacterium]|nr:hypothetical protein [Hyphomicrobiaceae bacterium]
MSETGPRRSPGTTSAAGRRRLLTLAFAVAAMVALGYLALIWQELHP